MERLDFINQRLPQKNKAKAYTINVDEAMVEYYWVYAKQIKPSYHIFIIHQNFRRLVTIICYSGCRLTNLIFLQVPLINDR